MRRADDLASLQLIMFEPSGTGHYMRYAAAVAEAFLDAGVGLCEFWTSHEASSSHCLQKLLQENKCQIDVRLLNPKDECVVMRAPAGLLVNTAQSFRRMKLYSRIAEESSAAAPSIVFVPFLDGCWPALAMPRDPFPRAVDWGGIVMWPRFHHSVMDVPTPSRRRDALDRLLWWVNLRRKRGCIFTLDPFFERYVTKHWPRMRARVRHLVEPVAVPLEIGRAAAREALCIDSRALVLLVYGVISERKGSQLLASALVAPDWPSEAHVVVAGPGASTLESALPASAAFKLTAIDRFIEPEEEEQVLFAAADVVWLAYRRHYQPSAVLIQATSAGIPVLATDAGVVGKLVRDHQLGTFVATPDDVVDALRRLIRLREREGDTLRRGPGPFTHFTKQTFSAQIQEGMFGGRDERDAASRTTTTADAGWLG